MTLMGWLLVVLLGLGPGVAMAQDSGDTESADGAGEASDSGPETAGEPEAAGENEQAGSGEEATDGADATDAGAEGAAEATEEADEGVGAPAGDADSDADAEVEETDSDDEVDEVDDDAPPDESLDEEERMRRARGEYERRREAWEEREREERLRELAEHEEAMAARRAAREKHQAAMAAHKKKMMAMPQLALHLGGQQVKTFDPGWGAIGDSDHIESFSAGLDVWVHPNIGVSLAWSDSGEMKDAVGGQEDADGLTTTGRMRTFDAGAKAALAPRWLPIRPIARAAFGVRGFELDVRDNSASGNLGGRMARGAAPYGRFGAGVEVLTPRYFGKGWRSKGAQKRIRWGAGFMVEAGAEIGGGEVPAASSVDLGEFGRLDVGPWYMRAGLLLLF